MLKIKLLVLVLIVAAVGVFVYKHHQTTTKQVAQAAVATAKVDATKAAAAELASHCAGNAVSQEVVISISAQHMWACETSKTVYDTAVTTGATTYGDGTPTGTWHIQAKHTNVYLTGSDSRGSWDDFVKYWIPYDGDYGFHDSSWQTFAYGDLTKYQTDGSHGCVHMPLTAMEWLSSWGQIGTTVVIQS